MKIRFHMTLASGLPSIKLNVGRPTKDPEKLEKLEFDEFHHYPCLDKHSHLAIWSKKKFFHWNKKTRRLRINKQVVIKEMELPGLELVKEPFCFTCLGNYGKIFRLKRLMLTEHFNKCPNCRAVTKG